MSIIILIIKLYEYLWEDTASTIKSNLKKLEFFDSCRGFS